MAIKKPKFHLFTVKIMRAPPGAPPIKMKILDEGQSRRKAFYTLTLRLDTISDIDLENVKLYSRSDQLEMFKDSFKRQARMEKKNDAK